MRNQIVIVTVFPLFLLSCVTSIQTIRSDLNDRDLIGHWPMNEGSGATVHDRSWVGNHADSSGLLWVEEGGLWFDGESGSNLKITMVPAYDLRKYGFFTISAWARADGIYTEYGRHPAVVSLGRTGYKEMAIIDLFEGRWRFVARTADKNPVIIFGLPAVAGKWEHVALVWDGEHLTGYQNGCAMDPQPLSDLSSDWTGLGIGGVPDDVWPYNRTFHGAIKDVRLYKRALREDEIRSLMDKADPIQILTDRHEVNQISRRF